MSVPKIACVDLEAHPDGGDEGQRDRWCLENGDVQPDKHPEYTPRLQRLSDDKESS